MFDVMAKARSLDELRMIRLRAQEVRAKYMDGLRNVDARELAIHRRVSRLNYSRRCAEASAVQTYQKRGSPLAPGMKIGYMVRDASRWDVDLERDASRIDVMYYGKLLDKAWDEIAFVLKNAK